MTMATVPRSRPPQSRNAGDALRLTGQARLRALRVPLATNALLVAAKVVVWLASGSVSVLSEAVHSAVDMLVTGLQLVSVRVAARPADEDHAYGHGKFENLGAAAEAVFILAAAGIVIGQVVARLHAPAPLRPAGLDAGIVVMALSAVVNAVVSRGLARTARAENSPALMAEAAQLGADVWTAAGVAAGLIAVRLSGIALIDPLISAMIAGLIVKSAYDVTVRAFVDLTDRALPREQEDLIRSIIESHRDIFTGYHKLRTRRSGAGEFIDFHLQMAGDVPLARAHDLSDIIVADIKRALPRAHVLIHLEPEEGPDTPV